MPSRRIVMGTFQVPSALLDEIIDLVKKVQKAELMDYIISHLRMD